VAESLTGGMLCSALIDVPGASAVVRGGVVSYATDLKHRLLGVDAGLLAANGPVDPDVATQMAHGVRERLGADWGVATTGVAGPDPQDGIAAGTVYIAVAGPLLSAGLGGSGAPISDDVPGPIAQPAPSGQAAGAGEPDGAGGLGGRRIGSRVLKLELSGDRTAVRIATTRTALEAVLTALVEAAKAGMFPEHGEPGGR
jgi:nicotinamide-nucleotide amidase